MTGGFKSCRVICGEAVGRDPSFMRVFGRDRDVQGDKEVISGLPVSSLMDRETTKVPQVRLSLLSIAVPPIPPLLLARNHPRPWKYTRPPS